MGVYIEGMEMPTTEQGVRTINIYADGVVTNYAEVTIGKAVPVPPHGDLIERDWLLKNSWRYAYMLTAMEAAPIIIPAEEGER